MAWDGVYCVNRGDAMVISRNRHGTERKDACHSIKNPAESPNTDGINPDSCRNVHISNCLISVGDIMMTDIPRGPIYLSMFYTRAPEEPVSERTPAFRNLHFSNTTVKGTPVAGYILGLPERPVENVTFTDIKIDADTGFQCKDAQGITFERVTIDTKKGQATRDVLLGANHLRNAQSRVVAADEVPVSALQRQ